MSSDQFVEARLKAARRAVWARAGALLMLMASLMMTLACVVGVARIEDEDLSISLTVIMVLIGSTAMAFAIDNLIDKKLNQRALNQQ